MYFVKKFLPFQDSKVGKTAPPPLGEVVHGKTVGKEIHFNILHVGAGGRLSTKGVWKQGYQYLMVTVDDLCSFVWMKDTATCTAEVAVRTLLAAVVFSDRGLTRTDERHLG